MWMVAVIYWRTHSPSRLAWFEGWRGHLALSLHSSNEPGELSQWPRHVDSIIDITILVALLPVGLCIEHWRPTNAFRSNVVSSPSRLQRLGHFCSKERRSVAVKIRYRIYLCAMGNHIILRGKNRRRRQPMGIDATEVRPKLTCRDLWRWLACMIVHISRFAGCFAFPSLVT